ncbi:MAG: hypothetical protein LCH63_14555 [Candidatus Melainabacteria bacterium]|nr:hypothetical protein [Candidatus Melainabacteria bacterium]
MNILQDDLSLLTKPDHFLGWLGEDPSAVIRDQLEEIFKQQIATAWLGQLIVTAPPRFLTGARRYEEHENLPTQEEITAAITAATSTTDTESKTDNAPDNKTNENTAADEDSYTFVLVRAGLAMPFKAIVCQPGGIVHEINGVLTWVATGLDTENERKDNVYLDLDDAAESATDLLEQRLYEPDEDDPEESESESESKSKSKSESKAEPKSETEHQ